MFDLTWDPVFSKFWVSIGGGVILKYGTILGLFMIYVTSYSKRYLKLDSTLTDLQKLPINNQNLKGNKLSQLWSLSPVGLIRN